MRGKRMYSDEEKAAALACLDACGGNISRAASMSGVPESSLRTWAKRPESDHSATLRADKKKDLAEALESLAWRMLRMARTKDKLKGASLSQLLVGIGIAVDKVQALRSKPFAPPRSAIAGINLADFSDAALAKIQAIIAEEGKRFAEPSAA